MTSSAICTWFVADENEFGTFFPQIGSLSSAPESRAAYWRCIVCFFASSLMVNRSSKHFLFSNVLPPKIDGFDLNKIFTDWGISIIVLPITYRLPLGRINQWGNQFYIFDILDYFVNNKSTECVIVLDSDVLWVKSVSALEKSIIRHGALTYCLGSEVYPVGACINGLTREQMSDFASFYCGRSHSQIEYHGGEIYAARHDLTVSIMDRVRTIWPYVMSGVPNAPLEEAHFLSILYSLEGVEDGTANAFIKRMWTTFKHSNLSKTDINLTLWHLPSEKKTGFADLCSKILNRSGDFSENFDRMNDILNVQSYSRLMGWPRRHAGKLLRDFVNKCVEKIKL